MQSQRALRMQVVYPPLQLVSRQLEQVGADRSSTFNLWSARCLESVGTALALDLRAGHASRHTGLLVNKRVVEDV